MSRAPTNDANERGLPRQQTPIDSIQETAHTLPHPSKSAQLPGGLLSTDLEMFERGYISLAQIREEGITRVDPITGGSILGRPSSFNTNYAGLLFANRHPTKGHIRAYDIRLDAPTDKLRYVGEPGSRNLFYVPVWVTAEQLADTSIPIVIAEGIKKALSLGRIAHENSIDGEPRFIPLGLRGVWGWRGRTGKEAGPSNEREDTKGAINDFDLIEWGGRTVYILFDSNRHGEKSGDSVRAAERSLAHHLHCTLEANVLIAEMTVEHFRAGINGPDDLAGMQGPEAVLALIDNARPAIKPATQPERESTEERIRRGAALRALTRAASQPDAASNQVKSSLGVKLWKRIAYLLAQGGKLGANERDLIWSLLALGEGETAYSFYYQDLYPLLWPIDGTETEDGRLTSAARQRIRRRFDEVAEAEAICGLRFVEFTPGYQDSDGARYPSHVALVIFDLLDEIENLAATDPAYQKSKAKAFERAVSRFVEASSGRNRPAKIAASPRNETRRLQRAWKQAGGLIANTIERMERQGYEPWAISQDLARCLTPKALPFLTPNLDILEGTKTDPEIAPNSDWTPGIKFVPCKPGITPADTTDSFAEKTVFNQNPRGKSAEETEHP